MALDVVMPQMGESVVEGTIAKWLVKEGDRVKEDQPLVEISTDKVDTEIPSPSAGVIAKILVAEGETVPVGARLAVIEPTVGAAEAAGKAASATPAVAEAPAPAAPVRPAPPAKPKPPIRPAAPPSATAAQQGAKAAALAGESRGEARPPLPVAAVSAGTADGRRRYSPIVLRMASEHAIDLGRVSGTGIGGRVTKLDVERYVESLRQGPIVALPAPVGAIFRPPIYEPREGDVVEPFSRRRRVIAEHMVFSKSHAPHVGTVAEVDMTRVARLREKHRDAFREREDFALTILPMVAAATVHGLKEFPRMNASVVGDSLVIRKAINLGIAMDDQEGLLVPVIRSAEAMSVVGLARAIENLRGKIAEKRITADDLVGGSFTLSNPGREGNAYGFAIINQPQVGILRMGELKRRPVVIEVDGEEAIAIRTMMYLALSYDHRVIDGVLANRFLYRVARILEEAEFEL